MCESFLPACVERETGRQLKCVRADNGGEYRGPFEKYCRDHGIRLEMFLKHLNIMELLRE